MLMSSRNHDAKVRRIHTEITKFSVFFTSILPVFLHSAFDNHLIDVQQIKNVYNTQKQFIKLGLLNIRSLSTNHFL